MKTTQKYCLTALIAACMCLTVARGASVGPAGYTNSFTSLPVAADFATSAGVIAGISADITTLAELESNVQGVSAGSIASTLVNSSPADPPLKLQSAQWTSGGTGYIVTRPTGNRASVILSTLVNNTGTNCNTLHLNYQLTVGASFTESVAGQWLYYSFSGAPNEWTSLPGISGLDSSQLVSTNVSLKQTWANGQTLYLLWADDNNSSTDESAYEIDNFFASAYYFDVPLTIALTDPSNGEHFGFGQTISASVALTGLPTNVSYYVDGSLAVQRTAAPFTPVDLPEQSLGSHEIYATARDASNTYVISLTSTFVVDESLGGNITTNTTLDLSNSPYTVSSSITVASNVTLTIDPGVIVRFRKNCGMTVNGRVLANGATNQPIVFTRYPGDLNWERMMFVEAADSVLRNCIFEYANCAGDHKTEYYATNCAYPMNVAPRNYFEAITVLACHLDIEGCVFTNLFTPDGLTRDGDAIGIFSDDLVHRGPASANVRGCRFLYIGQGVHTRYAYALVENCYFVGKHGDNDDVEMYGESTLYGLPTPMIRSNLFGMPCYDDRIHPTRCSAIIRDNLILGSGDHAIVLRDTCCPIVFNNIIFNTPAGGISIQNGCDALIANNTFYGISGAVKLFDHRDRIVYPYCLSAMSGRATVINNIIWNGTRAIDVSGSAGAAFTQFQVNVSYCDIQGGTSSIAVGSDPSKYKVEWGPGILNADPLFIDVAQTNVHLAANSPCLDAGSTNLGVYITTNTYFEGTSRLLYTMTNDLGALITQDVDRRSRPLDGNGDGVTRYDLGAYEIYLPTADSNNDGIPDSWCVLYGLSPNAPNMANEDPDHDGQNNLQEYLAGTDPTNPNSYVHVLGINHVGADRSVAWSNAYNPGVLSVLTATNILGPWRPRENYFTTNSLGQTRVNLESDNTFFKLLAVDISTNTPLHFSNVVHSYGILETVAGRGLSSADASQWLPSYEGNWATNVCLSRPHTAFGDSKGNVLIVDQRSSSILKVTPEGRLYTFAGDHIAGANGDTGWATNLHLNNPNGAWLGTNDVFYVLDTENGKVRRITPEGYMTTLFTTAHMGDGRALWVKSDESVVYFGSKVLASTDWTSKDIYKWTPTGGVTLFRSGFGELGNISGDERTGDLYVSDRNANRVYRMDTNGILTTIAGNGTTSGGGDGFPALQTGLIAPRCASFLPNGGWFTSEHSPGNRIWYIDPAGIIHLWINGNDNNNWRVGDGQWFNANPTTPKVSRVRSVNPDPNGNLIITESNYGYVRRVRFQRMNP